MERNYREAWVVRGCLLPAEVSGDISHWSKSLVTYSDGCGGQNKNLTILGLYCELHRNGTYDVINHKFLTRGHTFLRNDTDFAQIYKRKASATIHLPEDWCQVVREANRRNPFEVVSMKQEDFQSYKKFVTGKYTGRHVAHGVPAFTGSTG